MKTGQKRGKEEIPFLFAKWKMKKLSWTKYKREEGTPL